MTAPRDPSTVIPVAPQPPLSLTGYDPTADGADCAHCPMVRWAAEDARAGKTDGWRPVPAQLARGNPLGLLLGEAPAKNECEAGVPFVGESGRELDRALREVGVQRAVWHIDNVIACRAPKNKYALIASRLKKDKAAGRSPPWEQHPAVHCRPRLWKMLSRVTNIVPMGSKAVSALLGGNAKITDLRGGPIVARREADHLRIDAAAETPAGLDTTPRPGRYLLLPTFHPAFVRRARRWRIVAEADLRRAVRFFRGELDWVDPPTYLWPTPEQVEWFLAQPSRYWTYDTETSLEDPLYSELYVIGIARDATPEEAARNGAPDAAMCISLWRHDIEDRHYTPYDEERIFAMLRRAFTDGRLWVGHNAVAFDRQVIERHLGVVPTPVGDTMLLHKLVASELWHGLGVVGSIYTDVAAWKQDNEGEKLAQTRDDTKLALYCAQKDCAVTHRIFPILHHEVERRGQNAPCPARPSITLVQLDHRILTEACVQLHKTGMYVDQDARGELEAELEEKVEVAREALVDKAVQAGWRGDFNPNSLSQLGRLLFDKMALTPAGYTDAGDPSTNDEYLREMLVNRGLSDEGRGILIALRGYRRLVKSLTAFVRPMRLASDPEGKGKVDPADGRLRPQWKNLTVTGRLSSLPNAQNIPAKLRKLFVAQPGHALVGCDLDQLEFRIAACRWGLVRYLKAFEDGLDPHQITMELAFGKRIWNLPGAPPEPYRYHKKWPAGPWGPAGEIGGKFKDTRKLAKTVQYACAERGTRVATLGPEGAKPIEDIEVGEDHTWTWDGEKYVPAKIIEKKCHGMKECMRVAFKWRSSHGWKEDSVVFTADHRFLLRDGSYREAAQLRPDDRLMPFNRWPSGKYRFLDPTNDGARVQEQRVVRGHYDKDEGGIVHHRNEDPSDNRPSNLEELASPAVHDKKHWYPGSPREAALRKHNEGQWNEENREETNRGLSEGRGRSEKWRRSVADPEVRSAAPKKAWANPNRKRPKFLRSKLDPYAHLIGVKLDREVAEAANCTPEAVAYYRKTRGIAPPPGQRRRKREPNNHVVVAVEPVGPREVWDIEVDHPGHNFALEAGIFVHNSQYGGKDETVLKAVWKATDDHGGVLYAHYGQREIGAIRSRYFAGCPEMPAGWEMEEDLVTRHGFGWEPITGRRRDYLDGRDRNEEANFPTQCVTADTRVITNRGYVPIEQLVGQSFQAWTGTKWAPATAIEKGTAEIRTLRLDRGVELACDNTHKVKSIGRAAYEWRRVEELGERTDHPRIALDLARPLEFGGYLDADDAYALGYWIADGSTSSSSRYDVALSFTIGEVPRTGGPRREAAAIEARLRRWAAARNLRPRRQQGIGCYQIVIEKGGREWLRSLGADEVWKAATKRVPERIWRACLSARLAFFAGVLDGDGYQTQDGAVVVKLCQRSLLEELWVLARTIGIDGHAIRGPYMADKQGHLSYALDLSGAMVYAALAWGRPCKLRTCASGKTPRFETVRVWDQLRPTCKSDGVIRSRIRPNQKGRGATTSPYVLRRMGAEDIHDHAAVASVGRRRVQLPVYTLIVDDPEHSYVAGGIIAHNSSGAGIVNLATIDILDRGYTHHFAGPGTGLIQQGHDALVLEVPEDMADQAAHDLQSVMEQHYPSIYETKFTAEAAIGHSWYEV